MNPVRACCLVSICCVLTSSCTYQGGERLKHEIRKADGVVVTCFEPPPEVVKKASIDTDLEASAKEIGALAKASVRGDVSPERIREKLPSSVAAYEVIEFRMCLGYANGLYNAAEYRAFIDAKSGLTSKESQKEGRKSPLKEGVSVDSARNQLIQFIEEGPGLLKELDTSPLSVSQDTKGRVNEWVVKVRNYLVQNFVDPTYALRFKNFAGLPPPGIPLSIQSFNNEYLEFRANVEHRLIRLHQFLDTLRE